MTKAILTSELETKIENLIDKSDEEYDKGDFVECIKILEEAWDRLPEPKGNYSESYHIAMDISNVALKISDLPKAKKWSELIFQCALHRIDSGDREFLAGKVAFESGDLEKARELFSIADIKSESRCFEDEDVKYKNFFITGKKPNKTTLKNFTKYNFKVGLFGIYNDKEYSLVRWRDGNFSLYSNDPKEIENGFEPHDGGYRKKVTKNAISAAYKSKLTVIYQSQEFECYQEKGNEVLIVKKNCQHDIAQKLQLKMIGPNEYEKWIDKKDIEDVIEEKLAVEGFPLPEE